MVLGYADTVIFCSVANKYCKQDQTAGSNSVLQSTEKSIMVPVCNPGDS